MTTPVKPPSLDPNHIYIQITSPLSPSDLSRHASAGQLQLRYLAPVGELKGEHIFEVIQNGQLVQRDHEAWVGSGGEFIKVLKGVQGVKGVKVMDVKQRTKR
ncbi:hypothetical protein M231_06194 [Tremella mesenterica]|uniref:Uncharacterized protein n=1 Tax=Tremella mesenterica TaxID=5217 RepID=A0A4Q1BFE1_TREME|nr:uncharacterized protein TREMEDRAFT_58130 [Tremella mesenterica DSM 1558]EIW71986.1 hypothetical protein TREMEDRAFT_58130 [Tremella mesenterica DSM 1558]RXK36535.1 hypothetical protein M231_06194 [Tremella mesenterica]